MGVGWIDKIYNNSGQDCHIRSVDSSHNGVIRDEHSSRNLDGGPWHLLSPGQQYRADWCGIPWYWQGQHFKSLTFDVDGTARTNFFASQIEDKNWIVYYDETTGEPIGRLQVPKVDFRVWLRLYPDKIVFDVVNDSGPTWEALADLYDAAKFWVPIALDALGAVLKKTAGG